MSTLFIYILIIGAALLLIAGFVASAYQFKKMDKDPESYRHRFPVIEGDPEEQRKNNYNQL
jgi:hypothetical protein